MSERGVSRAECDKHLVDRVLIVSDAPLSDVSEAGGFASDDIHNGVQRKTQIFAKWLYERGCEVRLMSPSFEQSRVSCSVTSSLDGRISARHAPMYEMRDYPIGIAGRISPRVQRGNGFHERDFLPDVVYLASPASPLMHHALWYAKARHVPVVANYQTDIAEYIKKT